METFFFCYESCMSISRLMVPCVYYIIFGYKSDEWKLLHMRINFYHASISRKMHFCVNREYLCIFFEWGPFSSEITRNFYIFQKIKFILIFFFHFRSKFKKNEWHQTRCSLLLHIYTFCFCREKWTHKILNFEKKKIAFMMTRQ